MEQVEPMNKNLLSSFIFFFLILSFLNTGCNKKEDSGLTRIKTKAIEFSQKQKELEDSIKKLGDSDFGKKNLLEHELELLKSRMVRLEEEAKAFSGGEPVSLFPSQSQASSGH